MFKKRTVFVLGAGASAPYGYPTGRELLQKVVQRARTLDHAKHQIRIFAERLGTSGAPSVDAFLEFQDEPTRELGKRLVARELLLREDPSWFSATEKSNWYAFLFHLMAAGVRHSEFARANRVHFVTFNYDRSLEQYLWQALQARYGISGEEAARLASDFLPFHVHGHLGLLPWQDPEGREYRASSDDREIARAAESIRIIHDDADCEEAIHLVASAEEVYFLGFGFHPANMRRIGWTERRDGGYGTCTYMAAGYRERVNAQYAIDLGHKNHAIVDYFESNSRFLESVGW